jgi:hypothetical protein
MVNVLGKFQTREFTSWKGLTRDNHLGAIFAKAPQKATNLMVQLLAYQRGKTLDTLLSQFPTREFESDEEYTWDVVGSSRRSIPLIEARDENGAVVEDKGQMVGAGTAPFYLVFGEDWFANGEYIVGNLNEVYQFRILDDARLEGSNAVYKVELAGGNTDGVPAERLLAGEKFTVEAAFVEAEMSRKVGDIRFSAPVSMRNEFSTIRIQHKVPGNKLNKKLAVGIPVVDQKTGKSMTQNMWMHYVDYELECQFSDYKNNALAFGKSNRNRNGEYTNIGKSGGVIKTGAGLYEQMEVANTYFYNDFSLKLIEDALYELSASKLGMNKNERYFLIKTGERGAIQFHKAILQTISGWTAFQINGDNLGIVERTQSQLHTTALSAGFQFVEYKAPNNVRVKIDVDPYYDDPVRNKVQHPLGGPAFSYRYDIMDIGTMDQPNIFKCTVKGQPEMRGYQWGPFRNPFTGQMNNPYASYDEDSAVIHKMATLGICVLDPTRTLSLIPAVLSA